MTDYPIIANCNYESADDPTIHLIRQAVDAGLTDDTGLLAALADLEQTLTQYADSGSPPAVEACEEAEAAVLDAWTDEIQAAVEAERRRRYL